MNNYSKDNLNMSADSLPSKILKLPFKLGLGTLKALKAAIFTKGGVSKRVQLFAQSMIDSVHKVHKEKEKAEKKAQQDAKTPVKNTMGAITEAVQTDDTLSDDEKKDVEKAAAEALRDHKKGLSAETKKHTAAGLAKVKKDKDDLTLDEQLGLTATGIITLRALRKRFKKPEFKKIIASLKSTSTKTKFPIKRVLSQSLVGVFKLNDEKSAELFLKRLRIQPQNEETNKLFAKIGKGLNPTELDKVARMLKSRLFKKTKLGNVKKFLKLAKKLIKGSKSKLNVDDFTEFVYKIDPKDYPQMIEVFVGKSAPAAKKGA
jgi:hypothetical protein